MADQDQQQPDEGQKDKPERTDLDDLLEGKLEEEGDKSGISAAEMAALFGEDVVVPAAQAADAAKPETHEEAEKLQTERDRLLGVVESQNDMLTSMNSQVVAWISRLDTTVAGLVTNAEEVNQLRKEKDAAQTRSIDAMADQGLLTAKLNNAEDERDAARELINKHEETIKELEGERNNAAAALGKAKTATRKARTNSIIAWLVAGATAVGGVITVIIMATEIQDRDAAIWNLENQNTNLRQSAPAAQTQTIVPEVTPAPAQAPQVIIEQPAQVTVQEATPPPPAPAPSNEYGITPRW